MFRCAALWLIATLFVVFANPAHAAINAYLCITDSGYHGEVTSPLYSGCSQLVDFGQTAFLDGATPVARDIKLDKNLDTASDPLRTAMINLTTLNEVKIRVTNTAGSGLEFLDIRLLGARVDSQALSWSTTSGGPPTETIGFSAASIEIKYSPITAQGALGTPVYTCWNVAANTATNSACP